MRLDLECWFISIIYLDVTSFIVEVCISVAEGEEKIVVMSWVDIVLSVICDDTIATFIVDDIMLFLVEDDVCSFVVSVDVIRLIGDDDIIADDIFVCDAVDDVIGSLVDDVISFVVDNIVGTLVDDVIDSVGEDDIKVFTAELWPAEDIFTVDMTFAVVGIIDDINLDDVILVESSVDGWFVFMVEVVDCVTVDSDFVNGISAVKKIHLFIFSFYCRNAN